MALSNTKLQALCGAGLSRLWSYETDDTAAVALASGYFNGRESEIKKGDIIFVISTVTAAPVLTIAVVSSASGVKPVVLTPSV